MRWDNPITPTWFEFPDLAAFPDYEAEPRLEGERDLTPFYNAYNSGNIKAFMQETHKYTTAPWTKRIDGFFSSCRNRRMRSLDGNACRDDLYNKGLHVTQVDFSDFSVGDYVDELLKKEDWSPQPGTYDRGVHLPANYIRQVQARFEKAGIIKGASRYSGKEKYVANVFLHVSLPTDKHYKQFFMDAATTPRWTNLHIDPKEEVVKAIVYLEDIGPDNGGFGYVPESNRHVYDPLQEIFGRAITTGNYCKTPEERASVFALPSFLRVSYNFGRCIMDDSPLASELDDRFVRVTSDMGNVAVFDPGAGMHQGGLVKKGRRVSLQVLMK